MACRVLGRKALCRFCGSKHGFLLSGIFCLSYARRDIRYLEGFFSRGYAPDKKDIPLLVTIFRLCQQQEYMYKNHVHSVTDRVVSIRQPWIRPIVRGKASAPVEFGPKLDVSIDSGGYGRIEKVSFDAYNAGAYPRLKKPSRYLMSLRA